MTKAEAAAYLECDERTVTNYASDGLLETTYVKGKTRPVSQYDANQVHELKRRIDAGEIGKGIKKAGNRVNGKQENVVVESGKRETRNQEISNHESGTAGATIVLANSRNVNGKTETGKHEISKSGNNFFVISPSDFESLLERAGQGNTIQELSAKPLLTFPECAQLTGLSERSLRSDAKDGKLKARRQGRADRILRSDLDIYLQEIQK